MDYNIYMQLFLPFLSQFLSDLADFRGFNHSFFLYFRQQNNLHLSLKLQVTDFYTFIIFRFETNCKFSTICYTFRKSAIFSINREYNFTKKRFLTRQKSLCFEGIFVVKLSQIRLWFLLFINNNYSEKICDFELNT